MESTHDSNNNKTEKSYSLRPRVTTRKEDEDEDKEVLWKPRNRLRKKSKQKAMPLSKYRRKTANARERFRMREINEAFEALRRVVPHLSSSCENPNEKLTKISTLRLAMKYITALSNALQDPDFDSDADSFLSEWTSTPSDARESSTPSSLNDYSDLYEQFLSPSSSSSQSSPSPYSFSTLVTSDFSSPTSSYVKSAPPIYPPEAVLPLKYSSVKDNNLAFSSSQVTISNVFTKSVSTPPSVPHQPSPQEGDFTLHFLTSNFPSSDLTCTPSLLDELDVLSPHAVDLEDYL